MDKQAFLSEDDNNYKYVLSYYHYPSRWLMHQLNEGNPIRDERNWSPQYKYLNSDGSDVSEFIKRLPNNTGGIYVFELKGITLPFIENYILYVGRCQSTDKQNIRKRAKEYFYKDRRERHLIKEMFDRWGDYLFYRYCPDDNNDRIIETERLLIRSILPQYNAEIPKNVIIKTTISAFK